MSEWQDYRLEELAAAEAHSLATGPFGSAISSRNFVETGVPVIRGSNLSLDVGYRLVEDSFVFLTDEKAASFARSIAKRGDLVFTSWGTIGQVGFISDRSKYPLYVVSNKQMKMTPDEARVDGLFLYYLLSSPAMVREVQSQAIGTAVPGFNLGQLRDLRVRIPEMSVQRRVAAILGEIDDLIESNRQGIVLMEDMVAAIYREWFVHFRYPGYDETTVESSLGSIPRGWRVSSLKDDLPFALTKPSVTPYAGRKPYIATADCSGVHDISTTTSLTFEGLPSRAQHEPVPSSVWFGRMAGYRKLMLFADSSLDVNAYTLSSGFACLRCEPLWFPYVAASVMDREFEARKAQYATGATQVSLTDRGAKAMPWLIPATGTVVLFGDVIRPHLEFLLELRHENRSLSTIRHELVPKLVSGVIDVSNLDLDTLLEESAG